MRKKGAFWFRGVDRSPSENGARRLFWLGLVVVVLGLACGLNLSRGFAVISSSCNCESPTLVCPPAATSALPTAPEVLNSTVIFPASSSDEAASTAGADASSAEDAASAADVSVSKADDAAAAASEQEQQPIGEVQLAHSQDSQDQPRRNVLEATELTRVLGAWNEEEPATTAADTPTTAATADAPLPPALYSVADLDAANEGGAVEDLRVVYIPGKMKRDGYYHARIRIPPLRGARFPVFFCKAQGPKTLVSCFVGHREGDMYTLTFRPAEAGHYNVHVRLEYADLADGIRGTFPIASDPRLQMWYWNLLITHEDNLISAPMLLFVLPGSPFQVEVHPKSLPARPSPLPRCTRGDHNGHWVKEVRGKDKEPLLAPPFTIGDACPADCADVNSVECKPTRPTGRVTLLPNQKGERPPWFDYGRWTAYDCEYQRFTKNKALKCLKDRRVVVVGDSVAMQQCGELQCALHPEGCLMQCSHRVPEEECFERQGLNRSTAVCVSPEFFFGPWAPKLSEAGACTMCRSAFGMANELTPEQRAENIRAVRTRHFMGGPDDVAVLSVGIHDSTMDFVPWFRDVFLKPRPEMGGSWGALLESMLESEFGTVVLQTQVAIHKWVADTMNCSDLYPPEEKRVNCIRTDFDPKVHLNHPRILKVNQHLRTLAKQFEVRYPHKRLILLDAWKISETREDNTLFHSDQTHPCDEVYREMNQLLLNIIC